MEENPHKGHRQRVQARFLEDGLESFNPHEVLELLLFYAIPRRDTNVIAHRLLERFHTLAGVMDADIAELVQVDGISQSSAVLLKMIPPLSRAYRLAERQKHVLDTTDAVCSYFVDVYIGEQEEQMRLACLNDRLKLISCGIVSEGAPSAVPVNMRRLVEYALRQKCEVVILAHNHPNGIAVPSNDDLIATKQIYTALKTVGIQLIDHIIVAGEQAISLKEFGAFSLLV